MKRLLRWLNEKLGIVETDPAKNEWYAAADERLDHIAEHEKWARRGYRLLCGRKDCEL